jgi:hypothetical protein
LWDLIDHVLIDPVISEIRLLVRCQFKHLASRTHSVENLLVVKSSLSHGNYLIHGNKPVAVQIGSAGAQSFLWRGRVGLSIADCGFSAGSIASEDPVFVGANQVAASGADGTADKSSQQTMVLATDGSTRGCASYPSNRGALGAWAAWQLFASGCRG